MADENPNPGEGQATPPEPNEAAIQDAIRKAVDQEVKGLKAKNVELIEHNKKLRESLQPWQELGDVDPASIKGMLDQLKDQKYAELIKAGRINEVVDARVKEVLGQTTQRHKSEVTDLASKLEAKTKEAQDFMNRWREAVIKNTVAQRVHGLRDGALADVQFIVRDWFTVDDDGKIVATDSAPLDGAGNQVNIENLRDYLLNTRDWLFPSSQGGGLTAGKQTAGMPHTELMKLPPAERIKRLRRAQAK
jgi:hypothetical protein